MNRNITATILIVLAIGTYITYTRGKWDEVNAVKEVNNQYQQAIDNADRLIKVRDQVLRDYNSLSAVDRDNLNKMIPNTVDNIRLVIDMKNIAMKHGFTLKNIKAAANASAASAPSSGARPTQANPPTPSVMGQTVSANIANPILDNVTISFSISAPYQQFIEFMRDLESNMRIMDMTHLSMTANDNGFYDFNVELKTYWLRQ